MLEELIAFSTLKME